MSKPLAPMLFLAALGMVLSFGSAHAAPPADPPEQQVTIHSYKFDAEVLIVTVGTKVTWTNKDEVPHSVMSADKRFTSSPALDTGDKYSYVFTTPGTYEYFCSLHPFMTGKVIVKTAE